ncbi:MAG: hypothetical protein II812_08760, partial [Prevotella sp.]|nr:hypothetical protein [Prevotella sp.]
LEIAKGSWVEAIFAKEKPIVERVRSRFDIPDDSEEPIDEDADVEVEDHYNDPDDEDDLYDEEKLTEESYRTTIETSAEDLSLDDVDVADDDEY